MGLPCELGFDEGMSKKKILRVTRNAAKDKQPPLIRVI